MDNRNLSKENPNIAREDEIDLIELAQTLWHGKSTVIKFTVAFIVLGLLAVLFTPKEYSSSTSMVPQTAQSENKLGGLSSLAAMAGFDLQTSSGGDILSPLVFPQIINSTPFQLDLMNSKFDFSESSSPVSILDYFITYKKNSLGTNIKKYTLGLPGLIIKAIRGKKSEKTMPADSPLSLTEDQEATKKYLTEKVTLDIDTKQGFITISATFAEPLVAAQVAKRAQELLQKYIIDQKILKATDQLAFIEQRYQEKKTEFEKAQEKLAIFRDQNKNVTSALVATREERLQSEYSIAFNVFSEISKQLEQAKIKVKEETPVFSILEPATVPNQKSKPQSMLMMVIFTFLGGIIGIGVVFGKEFAKAIRSRWHETIPDQA